MTPGLSPQHSTRPPTCPRHQDSVKTAQSRLPSRRRPGRASELLPGLPLSHGPPGPGRLLQEPGLATGGNCDSGRPRDHHAAVLRVTTSPAPLLRQGLPWHRDAREGGAEGAGLRGRCVGGGAGRAGPREGRGRWRRARGEGGVEGSCGDTIQPRWLRLRRWTTWADPLLREPSRHCGPSRQRQTEDREGGRSHAGRRGDRQDQTADGPCSLQRMGG